MTLESLLQGLHERGMTQPESIDQGRLLVEIRDEVRALREALKPPEHAEDCPMNGYGECDCGVDAVLAERRRLGIGQ